MNRLFFLLVILIFHLSVSPVSAALPSESEVVAFASNVTLSQINSDQPDMKFADWLINLGVAEEEIKWEANDCGEGGDGRIDHPICAEVTIGKTAGNRLHVSVVVGSTSSSHMSKPTLRMVYLEEGDSFSILPKSFQVIEETIKRIAVEDN